MLGGHWLKKAFLIFIFFFFFYTQLPKRLENLWPDLESTQLLAKQSFSFPTARLASTSVTFGKETRGSLRPCSITPGDTGVWNSISHLPAITVAGNTGYQRAEWKSCSQGYPFNTALLQSRFSQGKTGQSNFLDFCKHGRKETCYTEAAEVLRWQTGAAWQKRRRSCQTNCKKAKIDLGMENADTASGAPSAEKSLPCFQGEHCHLMPPDAWW